MAENLVTVREAASFLRISARTVYRLIESGEMGAVRIGKQWRIPVSELPGHNDGLAAAAPQVRPQETLAGA
jgi:excisionase family DNA binding protein